MANKTYKQHLEKLLKQDPRFVDDEGELMGNKVKSFTDDLDEKLIELLLQDEASRKQFFIKIKEVYVFKASDFKFFLEQNKIDNSFTNYVNRIGLSVGGKFLKDNTDVVLDFPYKDCILEGGQSTEEGLDTYFEYDEEVSKTDAKKGYKPQQYNEKQTKRKEIFFNTIVAKDEIDRLLEPKAFSSITKYDANGESKPTSFTRNAAINKKRGLPADTITDNLIIKGNNLLALHSLKEEFKGKVKLIYIDPPYNTGSDSFAYNDKFNHSSWLTFMYNRLQVAKELLKEDGAIFISINHIELSYISILLDTIFDNNKLPLITLKAGTTASYRSINDCPVNVSEYILAYSKSLKFKPFQVYRETKYSEDYSHFILNKNEKSENWKLKLITNIIHEKYKCVNWREFKQKFGSNWKVKRLEEMEKFAFENKESIVSLNTLQKPSKTIQEIINLSKTNREKVYTINRSKAEDIYCYNGRTLAFYSSKFREIDGENVPSEILTNIWSDISFLGIGPEGGVTLENGKKPEYLLKTILELTTNKDDIVLDYHLGSGTTAAVSMKMNRQFIGCEQITSQIEMSKTRLQNVINKDNSGISQYKDVNWKGGGSFTYLELAKNNQHAKDQILTCNDYNELMELFNDLYSNYFLHYNLKIKEFKEVVSKEEKFIALALDTQKEIFCKMLDNNQLYVNVSEMEDSKHNIAPEDIALTKDFYQIKE